MPTTVEVQILRSLTKIPWRGQIDTLSPAMISTPDDVDAVRDPSQLLFNPIDACGLLVSDEINLSRKVFGAILYFKWSEWDGG